MRQETILQILKVRATLLLFNFVIGGHRRGYIIMAIKTAFIDIPSPGAPRAPTAPGGPRDPVLPIAPSAPAGPEDPAGPTGPCTPLEPEFPLRPRSSY